MAGWRSCGGCCLVDRKVSGRKGWWFGWLIKGKQEAGAGPFRLRLRFDVGKKPSHGRARRSGTPGQATQRLMRLAVSGCTPLASHWNGQIVGQKCWHLQPRRRLGQRQGSSKGGQLTHSRSVYARRPTARAGPTPDLNTCHLYNCPGRTSPRWDCGNPEVLQDCSLSVFRFPPARPLYLEEGWRRHLTG